MTLPPHLINQIENGEVCLVLGAGCSLTSTNGAIEKIPSTSRFCEITCKAAGLPYAGESPKDVFQAVRSPAGPLSATDLKKLFLEHFTDCLPSPEMNAIMGYCWRRIYTFNVDDVIRNTQRSSRVQRLRNINAMREGRSEWRNLTECQVIHLHGFAGEYENGVIFSREEYAKELHKRGGWYESIGEDFSNHTLLIVGTSLDEPILDYHINTFAESYSDSGKSYLITPNAPSEIRRLALKGMGVEHIEGDVASLVGSLKSNFPDGLPPSAVKGDIVTGNTDRLSPEDLEGLRSFYSVDRATVAKSDAFKAISTATLGRKFFEGYGPETFTVAAGIPAILNQDSLLEQWVWDEFNSGALGICITGEAGCGKSTFTFKALSNVSTPQSCPVYVYRENSTTMAISLLSLERFFERSGVEFGVVLIDESHVYAEQIGELHASNRLRRVRILTSSRSSEWQSRIRRTVGPDFKTKEYKRFIRADIENVVEQLTKFYPSPTFTKLNHSEKVANFAKSKQQLLIALREATSSEVFDDMIQNEFGRITNEATRLLLAIICWATIARVGLNKGVCQSIYSKLRLSKPYHEAFAELEGIVDLNGKGRLVARHELYAAVIVDTLLSAERLTQTLEAYFEYFSGFDMPVIQRVDRLDAQLFKYCLSSKNIYRVFSRANKLDSGSKLFERFSIEFQLDGHFWLQWALFLRRIDQQKQSLDAMLTSVEAYPDNVFARHALAQQKLIVAGGAQSFGLAEKKLISEAVDELREQHEITSSTPWRASSEEYPIVTLANHHVDALINLGERELARKLAAEYFNEIEGASKGYPSSMYLDTTRGRLLKYSTQGVWDAPSRKRGQVEYG